MQVRPGSPPEHVKDRREDVGFVQHTLPILQVLHEFLQRKDGVAPDLLTDAVSNRAVEWAESRGNGSKGGHALPKADAPDWSAQSGAGEAHHRGARRRLRGVRAVGSHWVVGEFKNEMMEFSTPSSTNGRLISGHMDSR